MGKYFIYDGQNQIGPFEKSELIEKQIKPETPIWYEGLSDWTTADKLPELVDLFVVKPPPFKGANTTIEEKKSPPRFNKENKQLSSTDVNKKTRNKLNSKTLIILLISCLVIGSIIFWFIYQNNIKEKELAEIQQVADQNAIDASKKADEIKEKDQEIQNKNDLILQQKQQEEQKTPQDIRNELLIKEQQSPINYLSIVDGRLEENKLLSRSPDFFHHSEYRIEGYYLKGSIKNIATIASFKDLVLSISFFTPSNTLMEEKKVTIYKIFKPHSLTPIYVPNDVAFNIKLDPPNGFDSWSIKLKDATVN